MVTVKCIMLFIRILLSMENLGEIYENTRLKRGLISVRKQSWADKMLLIMQIYVQLLRKLIDNYIYSKAKKR